MPTSLFQRIFPNWQTKVLLVLYAASAVWWVAINLRGLVNTLENYWFNLPMGAIPLFAAGVSFHYLFRHTQLSAFLKKSIFFLSVCLVFLGVGTILYIYSQLFLDISVPYTNISITDIVYLPNNFFLFMGCVYLCIFVGLQPVITKIRSKIFFFLIPLVLCFLFYYLIFPSSFGTDAEFFFHSTYILGDIFMLAVLGILIYGLVFRHIPKHYKATVIIFLSGCIASYITDISFAILTAKGTYFSANWVDLFFLTALFFLSLGVLQLVYNGSNNMKYYAK